MAASSPPFTSPFSPTTRRARKSKFTFKNLSTLAQSSPTCPLRVIAHIDLDAFYAQCETVRLGVDPAKPLAVQQWQGLIAINYPARAFGLSRHVTISEAKEKCPEIICQHVATWKEGDTNWSYELSGENAAREIAHRKVSLDPYRIQSRRILALIKDSLPKETQKVEKASIDEVFLDLSAQVHGLLLERYPELRGPAPYDDPTEPLPRPPTTALDWAADALVDLDESQSEEDDPDWDDICTLLASEIVRDVRARIYEELHYTCSAGLSRNKMLAKLGSAYKKPNGQTVIRNRAVQHFLSAMKFTKIRNLGGKLGDEVVAAFNTEMVGEMLAVPIEQLKSKLGDETGSWLYAVLRGEDTSEVNPRTQIKSMLSAKSFRPSINSFEVACKWIRIFVADIYSRLVEEGVLENKRRPKTINLHHRQGAATRSKQSPIPMGKVITEDGLFELAKNLLAQVVVDGRAWPCANLSLSVGGFEDGVANNKGIGGFLVRGDEAKALYQSHRDDGRMETPPPNKRRRVGDGTGGGIARFFGPGVVKQDSRDSVASEPELESGSEREDEARSVRQNDESDGAHLEEDDSDEHYTVSEDEGAEPASLLPSAMDDVPASSASLIDQLYPSSRPHEAGMEHHDARGHDDDPQDPPEHHTLRQTSIDEFVCSRCQQRLPAEQQAEHEDFHFAQDLQNEHSSPTRPPPKPVPPAAQPAGRGAGGPSRGGGSGRGRGRGRPPKTLEAERGQKRLAFG